ncbi:MAG: peptide-methionine (R)-S-oxide reductase MsrB [Saprospiraceae bacterium]|nr:peptide-methionine (R)-S-oxide reductase MsrB [Saprospiraceae bacterium]
MKLTYFFLLVIFSTFNCAQSAKPEIQNESSVDSLKEEITLSDSTITIDTFWVEKIIKSNDEWRKILSSEEYYITREMGTEKPFSSDLYDNHESGIYVCVCCNNPLFGSDKKFNSGTGWPSFFDKYSVKSLAIASDHTHGMVRDALSCLRCGAHLGHVFDDGPKPTGLRYCIDGIALKFVKQDLQDQSKLMTATFAGGCFWCEEGVFERIKGVGDVVSGYSGGKEPNPTYEEVGSGSTGHAESFQFEYDPKIISYKELLEVYIASVDPTQVNGQGPDHGTQYRSIVFYRSNEEKISTENAIKELSVSGKFNKPIAIEIKKFDKFWPAEVYHQNYIKNNPNHPYVLQESIPRINRTKSRVPQYFK